ncbi:MAG: hypothetical protein M3527_09565, partial [Actinomycetota bacterium]|nr:hypothetical protein [Actinomycetota bacterium]
MTLVNRVLSPEPVGTLAEYRDAGGCAGLDAARASDPETIIGELEASGLRGRGGGGFPTGTKWRTVWENRASMEGATVVVNAAEGEPGTFKDRTILANNPFQVVEGALIAAHVVGADRVVFGMKASAGPALARLRAAVAEFERDDGAGPVAIEVLEGPEEYLYGEETALLEVISGRGPFPRLAPPFRRGVGDADEAEAVDNVDETGLAAEAEMAGPGGQSEA